MLPINRFFAGALTVLALLSLAACGSMRSTPSQTPAASTTSAGMASTASATGVVQTIERVDQKDAGIGVGSIAGAVVGSPPPPADDQAYRVTLRMDDGTQQVFATPTNPGLRVGDRIQVVNGLVQHY